MVKGIYETQCVISSLLLKGFLILTILTVGVCKLREVKAEPAYLDPSLTNKEIRLQQQSFAKVQLIHSGARYIRLHFSRESIPNDVVLNISDVSGQSSQRFDTETLSAWSYTTAYFNGDAVNLELLNTINKPLDEQSKLDVVDLLKDVRVETDKDARLLPIAAKNAPGVVVGLDDRVHSDSRATGRLIYEKDNRVRLATGWLTSASVGLSAGHYFCTQENNETGACVSKNPIQEQVLLEFNVPPSQRGFPVHPPARDQFPVDMGAIEFGDVGTDNGRDWAVFRINPNDNGSVFATHHGFFRLAENVPAPVVNAYIAVTGYGSDTHPVSPYPGGDNNAAFTEQESVGQILSVSNKDAPPEASFITVQTARQPIQAAHCISQDSS
jgi:hypothetical protein